MVLTNRRGVGIPMCTRFLVLLFLVGCLAVSKLGAPEIYVAAPKPPRGLSRGNVSTQPYSRVVVLAMLVVLSILASNNVLFSSCSEREPNQLVILVFLSMPLSYGKRFCLYVCQVILRLDYMFTSSKLLDRNDEVHLMLSCVRC